jgi:UDP-4-amino-4,6-dideoxy-N-acetyl-beta-L-altrosamine N-acetyltransferase
MMHLRELSAEDQERVRAWRNDPEIRKYMYTDHEITVAEHSAWFARTLKDPTCKYWIIVCDAEDVGVACLFNIDLKNRSCYWGFYAVGAAIRGKGVGNFAEFSVLRYVFEELKLQKLCCEVLAFNQAVINMHKKFGFVQEGLFRRHILKGDEFVDVVCLALLQEEWSAKKPELELRLKAKDII